MGERRLSNKKSNDGFPRSGVLSLSVTITRFLFFFFSCVCVWGGGGAGGLMNPNGGFYLKKKKLNDDLLQSSFSLMVVCLFETIVTIITFVVLSPFQRRLGLW